MRLIKGKKKKRENVEILHIRKKVTFLQILMYSI